MGQCNPHSHLEVFNGNHTNPDIVVFTPTWGQLVGVLKGLLLAFEGKPLLLMDEVGFSKTIQLIGMIAMLAYLCEVYAKTGNFIGCFHEKHLFISLGIACLWA